MARKPYDPLCIIPPPDVIRRRIDETRTLAERLQILLDLSVKLHLPLTVASAITAPTGGREAVARG